MPWQDERVTSELNLPFYARPQRTPSGAIALFAGALAVVGVILQARLLAAFGAGVSAAVAMAWYRTWRQCGDVVLDVTKVHLRVQERDKILIPVTVRNNGRKILETVLIRCVFPGSIEAEQVVPVAALAPREWRNIVLPYSADRGMGEYRLEEVSVIIRDPLALFRRCLHQSCDVTVEVVPEELPMEALPIHVAGQTMHSGTFESKASGDSPTFLGLRPFRTGDSIRRIDWKRSQRSAALIVREYERLNSTDATLIVDQRFVAQFEFASLNAYETLRDTVISLVRSLLAQQIRVALITPHRELAPSKGKSHFEEIVDVVKNLKPTETLEYAEFVKSKMHQVPPDSLLVPVFASAGVDFPKLMESLLTAHDRRVETIPVVIDTERFSHDIMKAARLTTEQRHLIWVVREKHGDGGKASTLDRFADRLADTTIFIGPRETLATLNTKEPEWRPSTGNH